MRLPDAEPSLCELAKPPNPQPLTLRIYHVYSLYGLFDEIAPAETEMPSR
jgi:hypothetical protein